MTITCGKLPEARCSACGSDKSPSLNLGIVGDDPAMSRGALNRNDHQCRQRFSKVKRRGWISLVAFRCPDCGHDVVKDQHDQWWDLDPSDYGDDGSYVGSATLFD